MKLPGLYTPPAVVIVDSSIGARLRKMLGDTYRETVIYGGPAGRVYFDEACQVTPEMFARARAILERVPVPGPEGRHIIG